MTEGLSKDGILAGDGKEQAEKPLMSQSGDVDDDPLPIRTPLKALKFRTVNKRFGWWAAVVLLESYAKKQICFYLWQKREDGWKRKQKFGIHSRQDWETMKKAVEEFIGELT